MKRYFACILLLLMPVAFGAQTRLPTQHKSSENDQANPNEMRPYEGRRIFSLEFRGNQHFSSSVIRELLRVNAGDAYSVESLKTDLDRLRVLFFARRGYLKARFAEPEIEELPSGLEVVVPVQEGILYRWRAIGLVGATVFSREEALKIIGLEPGEIADGWALQQGLSKLERLYRDRGYAHVGVGFIPEFNEPSANAEEGVVDIACEIEEGDVFRLDRIEFEGNSRTPDRVIRRSLLFHEGDVFNDSLIRKSLVRLNELGIFEKVFFEDIGVQTHDDRKQLDITIKLTEKDRE